MKKIQTNSGFSALEFLFAIVIASVVGFVIIIFAKNVINLNSSSQASMTSALEGRKIVSVMVTELRSAIPSALGSYAIESAATSSIAFFTDVDGDEVADRIRYYVDLDTRSLKRGVILATGSPPGYTSAETFSTLITDVVVATTTPIFDYYDGNYDGSTAELPMPVNIQAVRLIKVSVPIERDANRGPGLTILSSQATLRNLKDNI